MEADWSVEMGADDPVIVVPWSASSDSACKCRFIDLRLDSNAVDEIEEAQSIPVLRYVLLELNSAVSPFWTAKCDAWSSHERLDPLEMDAAPEDADFSAGSYIDLLTREDAVSFDRLERWSRQITKTLLGVRAEAARVELVLRRAMVDDTSGYGVTWFVQGCGATAQRAEHKWSEALRQALPVIMGSTV